MLRTDPSVSSAADLAQETIRVAIADDHPVVRAGIRMLLAEDTMIEVVGEAGDLVTALDLVRARRPDVLVLDLHLGATLALELLPRLGAEAPGTGVLIFTVQQEPAYASRCLAAGARGYLRKDAREGELVQAVRAVAEGRRYLDSELGAALATGRSGARSVELTPRQRSVLRMVTRGASNRTIADQLRVSVRTVEAVRAQIRERTGVSTPAELVAWASSHDV